MGPGTQAGAHRSGTGGTPGQQVNAAFESTLRAEGSAILGGLLTPEECRRVRAQYDEPQLFRSKVVMARHGYGRGEYQYFSYPLTPMVADLRTRLYGGLVQVAKAWNEAMRIDIRYPAEHGEFLSRCHAAGQTRPTPLLLKYEAGDYNCLHQDLYGEHVFPIQVAILLSTPREEFVGGEFVITEQRPRMQSRVSVVPLNQGDGVAFAVHQRPVAGARGCYRVKSRHGVSPLRSGRRFTLGIIFHDAR